MDRLGTNPEFLDFIFWFGVYAFLLGLAAFALRMLVQLRSAVVSARTEPFIDEWQRLLEKDDEEGLPEALPGIPYGQMRMFMQLWTVAFARAQALQSEAPERASLRRDRLCAAAERTGADQAAVKLLDKGPFLDRITAAQMLGWVGGERAWAALETLIQSGNTHLSLLAAQGLTRIDAERAAPAVVRRLNAQPDWSADALRALLQTVGEPASRTLLAQARLHSNGGPDGVRRLELASRTSAGEMAGLPAHG